MKLSSLAICLMAICFHLNTAAQPLKTGSGEVKRFEKFPSQFVDARNVDVWLPDKYSRKKKYAVVYMHDGQMLFDSTTTWNKQEWMVDEVMGYLLREKKIRDCIVVGVWNNGEKRREEYFPQKALADIPPAYAEEMKAYFPTGPAGDNYLKFLVKELKPFIDSSFSTLSDQSNTFIAGSSMGGLISMYGICEYPDVFGGAACMSTHWTGLFRADNNPVPAAFMKYLEANLPDPNTHRFYFDHGTVKLDALYPPFQKMADEIMVKKGYTSKNWTTRVFAGEDHSEKAWGNRLYIPMMFLLSK